MLRVHWRRRTAILAALPFAVMMTTAAAAQTTPAAGRVKSVSGQTSVVRGGATTPATVGMVVHQADVLRTGDDGLLAVMLKDETRISLGPNAEVSLTEFAYAPSASQLSLVLRVARGALSYISGRIATLMPDAIRLETPASVIGVRGTHALIRVEAP